MSHEIAKKAAMLLFSTSRQPCVNIHFHGGEPTLLSDEWYHDVVRHIKQLAVKYKKTVTLSIQTNATLLDRERILSFKHLGIDFSVSCDGPPYLNDTMRQEGTLVDKALRLLHELRIPTGINVVVHQLNCHHTRDIMDYFKSLEQKSVQFVFLEAQGRGLNLAPLQGEDVFQCLRQTFDYMLDTKCIVVEKRVRRMINRYKLGRLKGVYNCVEFECGAGRWFAAVDYTGRISPCDTHMEQWALGNVMELIDEAKAWHIISEFHKKNASHTKCFCCEAKKICTFGCTMNSHNRQQSMEEECKGTRLFWEYLQNNNKSVDEVFGILEESRSNKYIL